MIKPEDLPESLVYDVYAQMKKCLELDELGTPVSTEQQIADLLNLCIEAGLVVPASEAKVLRRAMRNVSKEVIWADDNGIDALVEDWIDQARKELESEGRSDQAE